MEIRPIIGWRNTQWEFIVNPIFELGFGKLGEVDFAPVARLARTFGDDLAIALEYYADLGTPGGFPSFNQQQHNVFAVVDFKVGVFDVDFGIGSGLTPGSNRFMAKTILSYAFPAPGQSQATAPPMKQPMIVKAPTRQTSAAQLAADPFSGIR